MCSSSCACVKNKNFCEKYCSCGPKCHNRSAGLRYFPSIVLRLSIKAKIFCGGVATADVSATTCQQKSRDMRVGKGRWEHLCGNMCTKEILVIVLA